jgi:uncharacterized protein (DUF1800 family)
MSLEADLALHRFGLGARPAEAGRIGDPKAWLMAQIAPLPDPPAYAALPRAGQIIAAYPEKGEKGDKDVKKERAQEIRKAARIAIGARMKHAVTSDTGFHERLVWFWSNHLAINAAAKLRVLPFAFDYERSAIRPHVTGRFSDMLLASARHPAMLFYLDNATSIGPHSKAGEVRDKGLNENYAREVMELHTMGAGSGYTQADITELARILTGWTIDPSGGGEGFMFAARRQEPGQKTVLGTTYEEGEEAGRAALLALARHPATAKRLSAKLASHFTADVPDAKLIAHLESDGDLGEVTKALVAHPAVWAPALTKARDPIQFVTAAARAAGNPARADEDGEKGKGKGKAKGEAKGEGKDGGIFRTLGQIPFMPPTPQGWPDHEAAWFGPDQVVSRVEWALAFVARTGATADPSALADQVLGKLLTDATRTAISRAPSPQEGLALLLSSPEFMRR